MEETKQAMLEACSILLRSLIIHKSQLFGDVNLLRCVFTAILVEKGGYEVSDASSLIATIIKVYRSIRQLCRWQLSYVIIVEFTM